MRQVALESIPVNRDLLGFPRVVIVEIVAGCNLACIMCPEKDMTRPRGIMDPDLFRRLVDEIADADPRTEVWAPIMGEVFMHRDKVFTYFEYAASRGLTNVNLNTNLVLFRPEWMDQLERSRLNRLTIGLDATTEETYRRIRIDKNPRRKGNFKRVEDNVRALLAAKAAGRLRDLDIVLQFIVQEANAHEEELFKEKWAGSGAKLKIRHKLGWGTAIAAENLVLGPEERSIPCPWLMRTMSIHWTGHVAQCDAMWSGREYVGDLNRQSIREIWMGELEKRRMRHLRNDFEFEPCRDCRDWQCGLSEIIAPATIGS